jgi:hypothetical protein
VRSRRPHRAEQHESDIARRQRLDVGRRTGGGEAAYHRWTVDPVRSARMIEPMTSTPSRRTQAAPPLGGSPLVDHRR